MYRTDPQPSGGFDLEAHAPGLAPSRARRRSRRRLVPLRSLAAPGPRRVPLHPILGPELPGDAPLVRARRAVGGLRGDSPVELPPGRGPPGRAPPARPRALDE